MTISSGGIVKCCSNQDKLQKEVIYLQIARDVAGKQA